MAPSSTESIDSKGKQKSVFSIFKGKKGSDKSKTDTDSSDTIPSIEGPMTNVEFTFNSEPKGKKKYKEKPLEADSIRIPLHSPTYYENRNLLQELKTSSQDSQETVIDVTLRNAELAAELLKETESNTGDKAHNYLLCILISSIARQVLGHWTCISQSNVPEPEPEKVRVHSIN